MSACVPAASRGMAAGWSGLGHAWLKLISHLGTTTPVKDLSLCTVCEPVTKWQYGNKLFCDMTSSFKMSCVPLDGHMSH